MRLPINQIIVGDCIEVMKGWPDGCVDLVLTDPPYGTTACQWDAVIPLGPLWKQLTRLAAPSDAIVLTASQPFTTALISSNMKMFKYCWVWEKSRPTGHLNTTKQPMRKTEDVCVFYSGQCTYNPQGLSEGRFNNTRPAKSHKVKGRGVHGQERSDFGLSEFTNYPINILKFNNEHNVGSSIHPTQKPVALMEYLIRTYSNNGSSILDFACGSGTTCVAAKKLGRKYIGIDISPEYCQIARERLEAVDTGVPVKEAQKGQMGLWK